MTTPPAEPESPDRITDKPPPMDPSNPPPGPRIPSNTKPSSSLFILQTYLSKTNTRVNRINKYSPSPPHSSPSPHTTSTANTPIQLHRLLSTTRNLDLTLSTLCYTSSFLSALLRPSSPHLPTNKTPPLRSLPSSLSTSLAPLASLLSETRTVLRLFGLLGIYPSIYNSFVSPFLSQLTSSSADDAPLSTNNPPKEDPILTSLARLQIIAGLAFQALENIAFLGDKGILRGIRPETRGKMWLWCCRAWGVGVALDLGRLGREWVLRRREDPLFTEGVYQEGKGSGGVQRERREMERREVQERWMRQVVVSACYAPMTVHYSLEGGLMSEKLVSLCGLVASAVSLRDAWRSTEGEGD
ncbi:MAG: hypothetical protein Q9184_003257 [Pyrenodesmia sp. 2 TL-2023]